ncbi:MAG TPA: DNA ligase D [Candidatus Limnocylindrales bacterium]|nr:DNA ligase D [Candidatus Limnocylindrales bacterium]
MTLEDYKRKRDFTRTPEPAGSRRKARPAASGRFVVQRHRATRLHYDFRLEIDGVLMSWAVPKGPSLDPAQKRMAVHVEDHPIEYFDFEGTIPRGQYGAGDVIVWDWGTFEPEETDDAGAAVRAGELKFRLRGEKLSGRWTLVRTRRRDEDKEQWLLIKKRDETARADWDAEDHPRSVKSGRTNDEVKAGAPAVWDPTAPATQAAIDLAGAKEAPLPDFVPPMKATLVRAPFSDPDWLFELKWDGYRVEAVVGGGKVRLWTRNRQDAARYFPDLAGPPAWIAAREAIVDGEVVALDEQGRPSFSLLQERTGIRIGGAGAAAPSRRETGRTRGDIPLRYLVFDLLHLDGRSLLEVPLEERKRLLRSVLREHPLVVYASHVETDGEAFFGAAAERGLEGMVAKHRRSRYEPGRRSSSWLKVKARREQELVVVGWEPGKGRHKDLGSLLVGVHDEEGRLVFAGGVGSGIDTRTRREFIERLTAIARDAPPVANPPRLKTARWVEPRIVIRAEFSDWTTDGQVRQAAYKGLELGKEPRSVTREQAVDTERATATAERRAAPPAGKRTAAPKHTARPKRRASPKRTAAPLTAPAGATPEELAALDAIRREGDWRVGQRTLHLTNLDKVLFPDDGITKRDVIRYLVTVAPAMLPHLEGRALNLHRFPDGITKAGFWQKEVRSHTPDWIERVFIAGSSPRESHDYLLASEAATLAWLGNEASFEIHPWTSRAVAPERPTFALIDIDPGERSTFADVLVLARLYRTALEHLGTTGLPKVTGKRGLQVWIPVEPRYSFRETAAWVEGLSRAVGSLAPELVSWEWEKGRRKGLIRLDYTQNALNKTLVAPYAVRPAAGAPVSAPIEWAELDDPELRPDRWTIVTMPDRLAEKGDLFAPAQQLQQVLPPLS